MTFVANMLGVTPVTAVGIVFFVGVVAAVWVVTQVTNPRMF